MLLNFSLHSFPNSSLVFEVALHELIEMAKSRLVQSISIYEFTGIINTKFTPEEKFELMKNLWRLIYTDQKLDKYEDQLVKKLGKMIHLEHRDVIAAKLMVKEKKR